MAMFGKRTKPSVEGAMTTEDLKATDFGPSVAAEDADKPTGLPKRFDDVDSWVKVTLKQSIMINGYAFGPGPSVVPANAFEVWGKAL